LGLCWKQCIWDVLPILMTYYGEFKSVFKESVRKCYLLWHYYHLDCQSLLNKMEVTYKVYIQH
jgi:hypothetical protein